MKINRNYLRLEDSYLFASIAQKVGEYKAAHPEKDVIRLGIGDVTLPLGAPVVEALGRAVKEMGEAETFRGYGDYEGYAFLRKAIVGYYGEKNVRVDESEVFVSEGAKSDIANILDLFDADNKVLIPDPVYPVYVDTNVMAGREILYMNGHEGNRFLPMPDADTQGDIIYICSPNNPTGAVYSKAQLKAWVDYANERGAVILFDAAYEAFVNDPELPTSIYQIEGAATCAVEICSFSKTAGFTGVRCGYTVVPHALIREGAELNSLWLRRQSTKFNGVSYITQRGAEAVFSQAGRQWVREAVGYYMENARIIADAMEELGVWYCGGKNSPYIWLKCPKAMSSWEYFDYLLNGVNVVGTPGEGFGKNGAGFFRLTAFGDVNQVKEAVRRIKEKN
ncbi:MAG: LL-diaminopimelate aminotransferase [Peptococcaceae bacterium]|jgi:LL-diaminopimelate aminotransferase|nr:LL-diaminopimelate aminotransferase [Peptococcaceae bacterium]